MTGGFVAIHERQLILEQFFTLVVRELTELNIASKMSRIEGITARASKREFFGDLDR
jgi:hypothetical protein